jgi:hypothetical protein
MARLGRILVQYGRCATVPAPEALENFDGRRLARPVGAKQREHLAAGDVEVDAVDGSSSAVALAQPAYLDNGIPGHGASMHRKRSVPRPPDDGTCCPSSGGQ